MLGGYGGEGFYSSKDIFNWKHEKELIPYDENSPYWNTGECQSLFEWNGFSYLIAGRTGFFMSRNRYGPYQTAEGFKSIHTTASRPRWDIYDGLWVPMVAPFKTNRRILAGWLDLGAAYAGTLVFRESVQDDLKTGSNPYPSIHRNFYKN
jgi:hypothetical protein